MTGRAQAPWFFAEEPVWDYSILTRSNWRRLGCITACPRCAWSYLDPYASLSASAVLGGHQSARRLSSLRPLHGVKHCHSRRFLRHSRPRLSSTIDAFRPAPAGGRHCPWADVYCSGEPLAYGPFHRKEAEACMSAHSNIPADHGPATRELSHTTLRRQVLRIKIQTFVALRVS